MTHIFSNGKASVKFYKKSSKHVLSVTKQSLNGEKQVKSTILMSLLIAVTISMPFLLTAKADGSTETVPLTPIGSGLTSPSGTYRWLNVADNPYSTEYQENYEYSQANVQITYYKVGTTFHGTLTAQNLKPNFAYQLKLTGFPGTDADGGKKNGTEHLGLVDKT
jgi:hypothetical protein